MNNSNRVRFEKPNLETLSKKHTVVDLHFHTRFSDGINKVKTVAKRAMELGIGIAITDHNEIKGAISIYEYKDLLTIPGIEITSSEGSHLLVYFYCIDELKKFYQKDVQPFMGHDIMTSLSLKMEDIIHRATRYNTVIIFAHPFCAAYTGVCNLQFPPERLQRLCDLVDGVEVINAGNINKWNLKCAVFGFNLNKAIVGGSDGHSISQMGQAVTYSDCKPNRYAFLDAIKEGHNKVVGKEIDFIKKFTSNSLKLRSSIRNYPDLIGKNVKYSRAVINSKSKLIMESFKRHFISRSKKYEEREFLRL
jgi:predicted metal-dependent phosphoesterase TrpH